MRVQYSVLQKQSRQWTINQAQKRTGLLCRLLNFSGAFPINRPMKSLPTGSPSFSDRPHLEFSAAIVNTFIANILFFHTSS